MSNPVFYGAPEQLARLAAGDHFTLAGAEGRHATTVKRLAPGEPVDVCDGAGLRLVCTVSNAEKGVLTVRIETVVQPAAPAITFTLIQALAKGDRDELAIEMATELGIDSVVPWQAERSIVRWKMDKVAKGAEKWRQVVSAAAKQARRSAVPTVGDLVGTAGVCEQIAAADLALILHEDATESVAALARHWFQSVPHPVAQSVPHPVAQSVPHPVAQSVAQDGPFAAEPAAAGSAPAGPAARSVLMIVGPEGGMSVAEVQAFTAAGARTALLGHHVLRSSTAGPAAVVLLSQELGRW